MATSKRIRWEVHVARMEEMTNAYEDMVGKNEGTRTPERPSWRWEDTIKADLSDAEYEDVDWNDLAEDIIIQPRAFVNMGMNLSKENFLTG
jgi:hypothetical protein